VILIPITVVKILVTIILKEPFFFRMTEQLREPFVFKRPSHINMTVFSLDIAQFLYKYKIFWIELKNPYFP